jgi:hypothetical protein
LEVDAVIGTHHAQLYKKNGILLRYNDNPFLRF